MQITLKTIPAQPLVIAVCPGIRQALGLQFFASFQQAHPDCRLDLRFANDLDCEALFGEGKADAAFLDTAVTPPACEGLEIVRSRLVAVVRRDHPFAKKQALSLSELSGMTVFILDKTHEMTRMFQKNYPELFATRNLSYSSNEYEDFCQLSRYLDGVALTFGFSADRSRRTLSPCPSGMSAA